jgi:hypothetical protein
LFVGIVEIKPRNYRDTTRTQQRKLPEPRALIVPIASNTSVVTEITEIPGRRKPYRDGNAVVTTLPIDGLRERNLIDDGEIHPDAVARPILTDDGRLGVVIENSELSDS